VKIYQLEHLIRAAGSITDENLILVIGSQSILAKYPNPPDPLGLSMEADMCPLAAPEKADQISGAIGEITLFQSTHGYYAHGLPPSACPLPEGWQSRLLRHENANTRGYVGMCLHPDDLACSKLAAGRPKDMDFVATMLAHKLVAQERLESLVQSFKSTEHVQNAERNLPVVLRKAIELVPGSVVLPKPRKSSVNIEGM
jgi:hypothetical protein